MDAYIFWQNLDKTREDKATLKEVCKINRIPYQRIADQRSECRFPKLEDAYLLAESYDVSLEFLLTGEDVETTLPMRVKAIALACSKVSDDGILRSIEKLLDIL